MSLSSLVGCITSVVGGRKFDRTDIV